MAKDDDYYQMEILRILGANSKGLTRDQIFDESDAFESPQAMSGTLRLLKQQFAIVEFGTNHIYTLTENEEYAKKERGELTDDDLVKRKADIADNVKEYAKAHSIEVAEVVVPVNAPAPLTAIDAVGNPVAQARKEEYVEIKAAPKYEIKDETRADFYQDVHADDDEEETVSKHTIEAPVAVFPPLVLKDSERVPNPAAEPSQFDVPSAPGLHPVKPPRMGKLYKGAQTGLVAYVVYMYGRNTELSIDEIHKLCEGKIARTDVSRVCSQLSLNDSDKYPRYFMKTSRGGMRSSIRFRWSPDFLYPFAVKSTSDADLLPSNAKDTSIDTIYIVPDTPEVAAKPDEHAHLFAEAHAVGLEIKKEQVTLKATIEVSKEDADTLRGGSSGGTSMEFDVSSLDPTAASILYGMDLPPKIAASSEFTTTKNDLKREFSACLHSNGELEIELPTGRTLRLYADQVAVVARLLNGMYRP